MVVAHNPRTAFLRRKNQSNERCLWLCGIHSWKLQIQTEFRSWSQPQSSICIACTLFPDNTSLINDRRTQRSFNIFLLLVFLIWWKNCEDNVVNLKENEEGNVGVFVTAWLKRVRVCELIRKAIYFIIFLKTTFPFFVKYKTIFPLKRKNKDFVLWTLS